MEEVDLLRYGQCLSLVLICMLLFLSALFAWFLFLYLTYIFFALVFMNISSKVFGFVYLPFWLRCWLRICDDSHNP